MKLKKRKTKNQSLKHSNIHITKVLEMKKIKKASLGIKVQINYSTRTLELTILSIIPQKS